MKRWRIGVCALSGLALLSPSVSSAQVTSNIVPDRAKGVSTGTQVQRFGPNFFILNGRLEGANLFHSFSFFDLAQGNAAVWARVEGDGAGIRNIINRVTGGSPSHIEGTFATFGMPNASFYFINPAGLVFGAGASVNVPNAAYFSTADELRFRDGARFSAATPTGSTFTSASPQAFGFLGQQGSISIEGADANTFSPASTYLSFSAGAVSIRGSSILAGGFDLFGVGDGPAILDLESPQPVAAGAGSLRIESSILLALGSASAPAGFRIGAEDVAIDASTMVATNGISGEAPGDVTINAGTLRLGNGTFLAAVTSDGTPGGSVSVTARDATVSKSNLVAVTQGDGRTGDLSVKAGSLLIKDGGTIGAQSRPLARGAVGTITVQVDKLAIESNGKINSLSYGEAAAGDVLVAAGSASIRGGGIQSITHGGGDAGDVGVSVTGSISVANSGFIRSSAAFGSTGASGAVLVDARDVDVSDGGNITATTQGEGDAGAVQVTASNQVTIARGGFISSDAETLHPTAAAGVVLIESPRLLLDQGRISTRSVGGNAGAISLETGSVILRNGSSIGSTAGGAGDAGAVIINADDLLVESDSNIDSSTIGPGDGGTVIVNAKNVTLRGGGGISSITTSTAEGGAVFMLADRVLLTDGGYIITSAHGSGNAGGVLLKANSLELRGSVITAATDGEGAGGFVLIEAKKVSLIDGGIISSDALEGGSGSAGNVGIKSEEILIDGMSGISATTSGAGDAGQIAIQTKKLDMNSGFITSQTLGTGNAGGISIAADELTMKAAAGISSTASAVDSLGRPGGTSGNVSITAASLRLLDGATVITTSRNRNPAGEISVASRNVTIAGGKISSENLSSTGGSAGSIFVSGERIALLDGGSISTNSTAGAAGNISLLLPRNGRLQLQGADESGVITTSSGPGTGGRINISNPYLILSNGGDILALGQQGGANVQIQSDYFIRSADRLNRLSVNGSLVLESQVGDLSSGTDLADVSFLDASSVLRGQCRAGSSGGSSQLTTRATGPYPLASEPDPPVQLQPDAAPAAREPSSCF